MSKETVRIVTDERTKEGTCFLSMGWGHGTIIESREQALGVAKALIDHYNIKQEELYPQWIACSDRMPKDKQKALIGLMFDGVIVHMQYTYEYDAVANDWYSNIQGGYFTEEDGYDFGDITHWHPIPTL